MTTLELKKAAGRKLAAIAQELREANFAPMSEEELQTELAAVRASPTTASVKQRAKRRERTASGIAGERMLSAPRWMAVAQMGSQ